MKENDVNKNKELLNVEFLIGIVCILFFAFLIILASLIDIEDNVRLLIIIPSIIFLIAICLLLLKIEQVVGFYECKCCQNKYIPTYLNVLMAAHFNRTRYLKCPKCNKKSWSKKVLN